MVLFYITVAGILITAVSVQERINIALNKEATQSSTFGVENDNGYALLAVDGNTDSKYKQGSCSHTKYPKNVKHNWWAVDLAGTYDITEVVVYNRDRLMERLREYLLLGGVDCDGGERNICYTEFYHHNSTDFITVINLTNAIARYINITLLTEDELTLCEVEVFGVLSNGTVREGPRWNVSFTNYINNNSTNLTSGSEYNNLETTSEVNGQTTVRTSQNTTIGNERTTAMEVNQQSYESTVRKTAAETTTQANTESINGTTNTEANSQATTVVTSSETTIAENNQRTAVETDKESSNVETTKRPYGHTTGSENNTETNQQTTTVKANNQQSTTKTNRQTRTSEISQRGEITESYHDATSTHVSVTQNSTRTTDRTMDTTFYIQTTESIPKPTLDVIHVLPTNVTSPFVNSSSCGCICMPVLPEEEKLVIVEEFKADIKKNLSVATKRLSKVIWRKVSAPDNRPAAVYSGYIGIALIVVSLGSLILPDILAAMRHIRSLIQRL